MHHPDLTYHLIQVHHQIYLNKVHHHFQTEIQQKHAFDSNFVSMIDVRNKG